MKIDFKFGLCIISKQFSDNRSVKRLFAAIQDGKLLRVYFSHWNEWKFLIFHSKEISKPLNKMPLAKLLMLLTPMDLPHYILPSKRVSKESGKRYGNWHWNHEPARNLVGHWTSTLGIHMSVVSSVKLVNFLRSLIIDFNQFRCNLFANQAEILIY